MKPIKLGSFCPKEKRGCIRWAEKYFKDSLPNLNDEISFGLSLVSWGVAEIPQIITKSGHGLSLPFLLTWTVGDIFNLSGCVLQPATVGYGTFLATSTNLPFLIRALTKVYLKTSGSRLLLQIKKGSVEIDNFGLNPLMFILALIANTAYAGSIVVRSSEWEKTKANMPWLLDAVVCVLPDFFASFALIN